MDPCVELRVFFETLKETRHEDRFWIVVRSILFVLGLDWLVDLLKDKKFDFSTLLDLLVLGNYALFWDRFMGLVLAMNGNVAGAFKAAVGKWFLPILIATIIWAIAQAVVKWRESNAVYESLAKTHYDDSDCETKAEVARTAWGHVPT